MGGILSQSSAHPLGERHHVGVVPLAEAQAAEVLVLRVPGVALQARRDQSPVDAEGRERLESASAAAALTSALSVLGYLVHFDPKKVPQTSNGHSYRPSMAHEV